MHHPGHTMVSKASKLFLLFLMFFTIVTISNCHLYFRCSFLKLLNHGWNLATLEYLWWERLWGLSIIIKRFSEQIVCNSTFRMDHPSKKIQWRSIEQKKRGFIAHGVIVLLFDSECIFMSKQTLMEDLFKLITNERRHVKKVPFFATLSCRHLPGFRQLNCALRVRIVSWIRNSLSCRTICWNNLPVTLQIWDHRAFLSPMCHLSHII